MAVVTRRYNYRAYLDAGTRQRARKTIGCARVARNKYVEDRERIYRLGLHKLVSPNDSFKAATSALKRQPGYEWMAEVSAVAVQQAVRDAQTAYKNYFESRNGSRKGARVGKPTYKKRAARQSIRFTKTGQKHFQVLPTPGSRWGKVDIPKLGVIRFRKSRDLPSAPSSVTVIMHADGTWEVSFVVKTVVADPATAVTAVERVAALDLGLTTLAAGVTVDTATGEAERWAVENPRFLKGQLRKLRRHQKALSRSQRNSKNRAKQRVRVAKAHAKVAARRDAHHRQVAHQIVTTHDAIAIEDLSVKGMGRTRLAKSVHDTGLTTLTGYIEMFAETQGKQVVRIGRWEPTTQTCSVCGAPGGKKPLSVRAWQCDPTKGCGTHLHRDFNAAVNILVAAGLAETLNACGGDVRRMLACADPDETGTRRTDLVA